MGLINHEKIIDILDILYIKVFRLKTSWDFLSIVIFNGNMENRYPDLTYSLKCSFGVDAYATIQALFSSGIYTFFNLKNQSDEFRVEYQKAEKDIQKILPDLKHKRDKMFCHFVEKQNEQYINDMIVSFYQVFEILASLHKKAMILFGVEENEIRVIPENKYKKLEIEKKDFSNLLRDGLLSESLRRIRNE